MTTYEKELIAMVQKKYGKLSSEDFVRKMIEIGVVDYSRCKVLAMREYVNTLMKSGEKKTNAMWMAAERFSCSYEYARKCMYYYTDVNMV